MYLLYLDDSGSAKNQNEQYLTLGGVCIFEHQASYFNQELDCLARKLKPTDPDSVEFHASAIFSGRIDPWNTLPNKDDRRQVIRDVLGIFSNSFQTACAFACAVHKASFPTRDPMELAFEDLCSRFDIFLKRLRDNGDNQRGLIILDESTHETTLQQMTRQFRTLGTQWNVIRNIADVPFFVDSKASRCVQVADHVAYAVFRRYEHGDTSYLDLFLHRFAFDGKILHGLCHKSLSTQNCMCPACFSRKIGGQAATNPF